MGSEAMREQPRGGSHKQLQSNRRRTVHLNKSDIEPFLFLPQAIAADRLGMSLSSLKNACRKLGIARWPLQRRRYYGGMDRIRASPPPRSDIESSMLNVPFSSANLDGERDADGAPQRVNAALSQSSEDNQDPRDACVLSGGSDFSDARMWTCSVRPRPADQLMSEAEAFWSGRTKSPASSSATEGDMGSSASEDGSEDSPTSSNSKNHADASVSSAATLFSHHMLSPMTPEDSTSPQCQSTRPAGPARPHTPDPLEDTSFDNVLYHLGRGSSAAYVEEQARHATACLDMCLESWPHDISRLTTHQRISLGPQAHETDQLVLQQSMHGSWISF